MNAATLGGMGFAGGWTTYITPLKTFSWVPVPSLLRRLGHAEETMLARTPSGDLGPFYPVEHALDTDSDLTRVRGGSGRALGDLVEISGRVLTADGTPQANARIEVWQANAAGRYAHSGDKRPDVPLDPNFQGYADLQTDADGGFRFLAVRPGVYPVSSSAFLRAPHIHLDVRGRRQRLVTQRYFEGTDPSVLDQDKLLQHDLWGKTNPLPATIFAKLEKEASKLDPSARHYIFDIVL